MMTLRNTSYWYVVFPNRLLWKKLPDAFVRKKMADSIPRCSRIHLTRMRHIESKQGKEHQGYVANLEETVGKNGSVVTDYQFEQNHYSDSQFLKDSLARTEIQNEESTLITDGAYSRKRKP